MVQKLEEPTVLVVDDEDGIRRLERRILEGGGYQVTEAANAVDALALLDKGSEFSLLIADLDMPGVGGAEMVRRIRALRPDLKVLYVTAHIDSLLDERKQLIEGEAFLDKPFNSEGLLEAVSLLLYGRLNSGLGPLASKSLKG